MKSFQLSLFCVFVILQIVEGKGKLHRCTKRQLVVELKQGKLIGTSHTTDDGLFTWKEFRGIPYARSPEGALRWKPPQSHQGWRGIYRAVGKEICPQPMSTSKKFLGTVTEDCLRLDVYVPLRPKDELKPLPVMVFIHGGSFHNGEKTVYNGAALSRKGVVVVNINYRLGILGFLSTGDGAAPGNFGLLDQQMAMKWVRDNIDRFGGDEKRITIYGHSAGSASVTYQMLANDGTFQRAISESGSMFSPWALSLQGEVKSLTDSVIEGLGCSHYATSEDKLACLRNLPVDNLMRVDTSRSIRGFGPVIDGVFLKGSVEELAQRFATLNIQFMTGFAHSDGLSNVPLTNFFSKRAMGLVYNTAVSDAFRTNYSEFLSAYDKDPSDDQSVIGANEFFTDWFFGAPSDRDARGHASNGGVTYKYYYRYASGLPKASNPPPYAYGLHGDITALVNGFPVMPEIIPPVYGSTKVSEWKISPADRDLSENIMTMWTNFAKTGDPNEGDELPGFRWKPYTLENQNVLQLDENLSGSGTDNNINVNSAPNELRPKRIAFWNEVVPKLMKSSTGAS